MTTATRLIVGVAALPLKEARAIMRVAAKQKTEKQKRIVASYERSKSKLKKKFKKSLDRVLKFAEHETQRKLHRYYHRNKPLTSQAESHPGAVQIGFNVDELWQDILTMLYGEYPDLLNEAGSDVLASIGYTEPWFMPHQDVLDFISQRENLLADVPDEIFNTIMDEISTGLSQNEGLNELSDRISAAFDEIDEGRADVIADNETSAAYNYASNSAAKSAGIRYKQWLHGATSLKPREDHVAIDGLIVPFNEAYPVGDPPLMFPHDENGSAEDVINCSCISIPVTEGEYQGQEDQSQEEEQSQEE